MLCDVYISVLHFSCYGMRSVMLQINEYMMMMMMMATETITFVASVQT